MTDQIQTELLKLQREEEELRLSHAKLLSEHQRRTEMVQQAASGNLNRLQQILGATAALKQLLNGENEPQKEKTQ